MVYQIIRVVGSSCQYHGKGPFCPAALQNLPAFRFEVFTKHADSGIPLFDSFPDQKIGKAKGFSEKLDDLNVPGSGIEPVEQGCIKRDIRPPGRVIAVSHYERVPLYHSTDMIARAFGILRRHPHDRRHKDSIYLLFQEGSDVTMDKLGRKTNRI